MLSTNSCIALEGAGVNWLTTYITRKEMGTPKMPPAMLLMPQSWATTRFLSTTVFAHRNQPCRGPSLIASALASSAWIGAFASAEIVAMPTYCRNAVVIAALSPNSWMKCSPANSVCSRYPKVAT